MFAAGKFEPAKPWRAFFLLIPIAWLHAAAPVAPPAELSQIGKPDAAAAARFLEEFRRTEVPEYFLEIELHALPRRGESRVFPGRMWVGRNADGAITRVEVVDGERRRHRLLIQDGPKPAIWREVDGKVTQLGPDALFQPIIPGIEATAFDLQRPYLHWPDATLQSINRVLGRPAYAFVFRPPTGFAMGDSGVAAVRVYFDTQFKLPVQSELLDAAGKVRKNFVIVSLKTIEVDRGKDEARLPLPKEVDFRNETTRDKTRLRVIAAAFRVNLAGRIFDPARLGEEAAVPAADRLVRLDP